MDLLGKLDVSPTHASRTPTPSNTGSNANQASVPDTVSNSVPNCASKLEAGSGDGAVTSKPQAKPKAVDCETKPQVKRAASEEQSQVATKSLSSQQSSLQASEDNIHELKAGRDGIGETVVSGGGRPELHRQDSGRASGLRGEMTKTEESASSAGDCATGHKPRALLAAHRVNGSQTTGLNEPSVSVTAQTAKQSEPKASLKVHRMGSNRSSELKEPSVSVTAHRVGSDRVTEPKAEGNSRSAEPNEPKAHRISSGRTSGLRGEIGVESESKYATTTTSNHPIQMHRQGSGRTSGLRGELAQQEILQADRDDDLLSSHDSLAIGQCLSEERYSPRCQTAVLATGNRPLLLGAAGSDTCLLLPEVTSDPIMGLEHQVSLDRLLFGVTGIIYV